MAIHIGWSRWAVRRWAGRVLAQQGSRRGELKETRTDRSAAV
jgi:hypothetical protein